MEFVEDVWGRWRTGFIRHMLQDGTVPEEVLQWKREPQRLVTHRQADAEECAKGCLAGEPCSFASSQPSKCALYCPACDLPDPKLRCSRCQQVRYCSQACQKRDWSVHKPYCMPVHSWELWTSSQEYLHDMMHRTKQQQAELAEGLKAACARALHVQLASDEQYPGDKGMLQGGYTHLHIGKLLQRLWKPDPKHEDDTWDKAREALTVAAQIGKQTGDWLLESQALHALVITRSPSDSSNLGAAAVLELHERSGSQKDVPNINLASAEWGNLHSQARRLVGISATSALKKKGIIMMKVALHRLTGSMQETCEVITQHSMSGAARIQRAALFSHHQARCPHEMLQVLQASHTRLCQNVFSAMMKKGDTANAADFLPLLLQSQETQSDAVQAEVQACIANCCELQISADHRAQAANARVELNNMLAKINKPLPHVCSTCLSDLKWNQASDPGGSIIVLPGCHHMYHLACLGAWRLKDVTCPEDTCHTHLSAFDEMVHAGVYIHGPDSTAGRISAAMDRALLDMLEVSECLPPDLLSAMTERTLGPSSVH